MLQGFEIIKELPRRTNDLLRQLFSATMPFLRDVQDTIPTIYTLNSGWGCVYVSGSTYRLYFNINNVIKYVDLT